MVGMCFNDFFSKCILMCPNSIPAAFQLHSFGMNLYNKKIMPAFSPVL